MRKDREEQWKCVFHEFAKLLFKKIIKCMNFIHQKRITLSLILQPKLNNYFYGHLLGKNEDEI